MSNLAIRKFSPWAWLNKFVRRGSIGKGPERRAGQPDSIIAPGEAPPSEDWPPEWVAFTPDIQKLLR